MIEEAAKDAIKHDPLLSNYLLIVDVPLII
jgi:hypothetical protein